MARAKKEAALTPEERLQAALVPDWEWPYKLPKNWCWTTVGTICDGFQYGYTEKATFEKIGSHFIRITDIGDGIINDSGAPYCKIDSDSFIKYKINKDDILIARMGSVGENGLATHNIDGVFASYLIRIVPRSNAKYVCNFLQTNLYWGQISEKAQGTTRLNVNANVLKNLIIPLAPLAEQQRIVDRIESLFAKLNEAKEKAQAVVDSFENRKAAILHKAFTGELTAKWREEHGVGMESWHLRTIGEVCENVKVGIVIKPSQYYVPQSEGTPAFRSANVRECRIDDFDWVYLNEKGMKDNSRSIVHTGDVLVVRSGNPGTACVVPERFDGYNAIDILIAVPNKKIIISDYLCYYTNSPLGKKTVEIGKRGIALTHFNVKGFSQMPINIPTIPEQVVIVRTLGDLFAQEQQSKEAAESVLDQIDLMKKSILARAFRGELGTNDPSEESAVELLKRTIL